MSKRRKLNGPSSETSTPLSAFAAAKARQQEIAKPGRFADDEDGVEDAIVPADATENADRSPLAGALHAGEAAGDDAVSLIDLDTDAPGGAKEGLRLSDWQLTDRSVLEQSRDGIAIHVAKGETVACIGIYGLTVRRGAVEIYGATIFEDGPFQPLWVYAPSTHALPLIRCLSPKGADIALSSATRNAKSPTGLERLSPLYRRIWSANEASLDSSFPRYTQTFTILFHASEDALQRPLRPLHVPKEWKAAHDPLDMARGVHAIAVVGAKGSGRSALCRVLSNAHVTRRQPNTPVVLLDLDPVYPMFSLHGQISAYSIRGPVIGPSYTVVDSPSGPSTSVQIIRSHCVPPNACRDDESGFMAAARELFAPCVNVATPASLVLVRMPEFAPGSNSAVVVSLLQHIKPNQTLWMARGSTRCFDDVANATSPASLAVVPSAQGLEMQRSADELHDMLVLSVFHQDRCDGGRVSWNSTPLNAIPPVCVSFNESTPDFLAVVCLPTLLSTNDLKDLLNASLVSIVLIADSEYASALEIARETGSGIPFVRRIAGQKTFHLDPQRSKLLGVALVRGVDTRHQHLRLIVPPQHEEAITMHARRPPRLVLVHGCLDTPKSLLLEEQHLHASKTTRTYDGKSGCGYVDPLSGKSVAAPYIEVERGSEEGGKKEGEAKWKSRKFNTGGPG